MNRIADDKVDGVSEILVVTWYAGEPHFRHHSVITSMTYELEWRHVPYIPRISVHGLSVIC